MVIVVDAEPDPDLDPDPDRVGDLDWDSVSSELISSALTPWKTFDRFPGDLSLTVIFIIFLALTSMKSAERWIDRFFIADKGGGIGGIGGDSEGVPIELLRSISICGGMWELNGSKS